MGFFDDIGKTFSKAAKATVTVAKYASGAKLVEKVAPKKVRNITNLVTGVSVAKAAAQTATAATKAAMKPLAKPTLANIAGAVTGVGTIKAIGSTSSAKAVAKAAEKVTAPIGTRVTKTAEALRLPSIAAQLNFKKALTDPKAYFTDMGKAYVKDVSFGATVYNAIKKGDMKGFAAQWVADSKNALTALQTGKAANLPNLLLTPPKPIPDSETPTLSQQTGEPPLPALGETGEVPMMEVAPPIMRDSGPAKPVPWAMIAIGGVVVLVLAVVVLR